MSKLKGLPDAIALYFIECESYQIVPLSKENEFFRRIRNGDEKAREHFIKAKLRNIRPIVLKFFDQICAKRNWLNQEEILWDLIGVSQESLIETVDKSDTNYSSSFATRLNLYVNRALNKELRMLVSDYSISESLFKKRSILSSSNHFWLVKNAPTSPRHYVSLEYDKQTHELRVTLSQTLQTLPSNKNIEMYREVFNDLQKAEARAKELKKKNRLQFLGLLKKSSGKLVDKRNIAKVPKSKFVGPVSFDRYELDDDFQDSDSKSNTIYLICAELLKNELETAMDNLSYKEREILILRYGLQDDNQRGLDAVAREFNITRERARQIEIKALEKLKHPRYKEKFISYLRILHQL